MIQNKYATQSELVTSSISGGRLHHTFRRLVKPTGVYEYETSYGENFYTLAMAITGDDSDYWMVQDINAPKDSLDFSPGDKVLLPIGLVKDSSVGSKFF